jgi:acyl-CoA dehydrogenase
MSSLNSNAIDFSPTSETEMILDGLDDFIDQEVRPLEDSLGSRLTNPRKKNDEEGHLHPEVLEAIETVRRKSADAGYYAMTMPEEYGGEGVGATTWYRVKKHVANHGLGLIPYVLKGPEGPNPMLLEANESQREEYLEPLIRGEKSAAFAQTEPSAGSDSPNMKSTAERKGDDWVINGQKQWITNAPHCDFAQVLARTTPQEEAGRYGGVTCFLVKSDEFELGSLNNAVGFEGMQAEIILDDVRVPPDRVLGTVDEAFYQAMDFLTEGRLELGAEAVGHAQHVLDKAIDYAQNREAFGRSIGKYQQISTKLAENKARLHSADTTGLRTASEYESGEDVIEESSIFHWLATQAFWTTADDAVQVHGASGLSEENPFMDHLHFARILRVVEGTDEIQLNTIAQQNGLL